MRGDLERTAAVSEGGEGRPGVAMVPCEGRETSRGSRGRETGSRKKGREGEDQRENGEVQSIEFEFNG